jgi:low affinity Fe/Cu permease
MGGRSEKCGSSREASSPGSKQGAKRPAPEAQSESQSRAQSPAQSHSRSHSQGQSRAHSDKSERWTFSRMAQHASLLLGKAGAVVAACGVILLWGVSGPFFGYSDTWQLVVNTGTTIVTFLMVFLVQNTQNRDARALHLKLDELLRSVKPARNKLIDLENCSDEEIEDIARQFQALREREKRTLKVDPAAGPPQP